MPGTQKDLDHWFSYHAPKGDQGQRYEKIRAAAKAFAEVVVELSPDSADRTVALRHIREAVFNANAAIALDGR